MKNIGKVLAFIIFFAILVMFTGAVSAANWTVNPGDSIQSVINNASANDTVIVNDNNGSAYTYAENLVINKTLQLQAKTGGNITIQALNSSKTVLTINSGGSGSTIQGFNIMGGLDGIYLNSANKCIITGNTISNNTRYGIYATGVNATVIGNNVTGNNGTGVYVTGANATISSNIAAGNKGTGVYVTGSNAIITSDNVIHDNKGTGLYVSGNNITLTGFNIYNNGVYGIEVNGINAIVIGNTVTNNTSAGIYVHGGANATVRGNTATGNNGSGINVSSNYAIISVNII